MERQSIVGQIYGYGVSLIAVLIIIVSIHGIVNGAFRTINPSAGMHRGMPMVAMWHMGSRPGMMGGRGFGAPPTPDASSMPGQNMAPGAGMQPGMMGGMGGMRSEMQGRMLGNARFDAIQALVLHIIMLLVGIMLFRWHWNWLHTSRTTS